MIYKSPEERLDALTDAIASVRNELRDRTAEFRIALLELRHFVGAPNADPPRRDFYPDDDAADLADTLRDTDEPPASSDASR